MIDTYTHLVVTVLVADNKVGPGGRDLRYSTERVYNTVQHLMALYRRTGCCAVRVPGTYDVQFGRFW